MSGGERGGRAREKMLGEREREREREGERECMSANKRKEERVCMLHGPLYFHQPYCRALVQSGPI